MKEAIRNINAVEWKRLKNKDGISTDREYAETIHSMNNTDHAFRLVVQRWKNPQQDLFESVEEYCYHVIAANYLEEEKNTVGVIQWHNGRSNSENYNKELKHGFNLDYVPCGEFGANAVWFGLGILAYNLFIASKIYLFPTGWLKKTIGSVRWQFIQMAGRIIRKSRYIILRICGALRETYEIYRRAREKCWELQYIL
ncbi:MAG: transposase [Elusimicrobiota bacterium]